MFFVGISSFNLIFRPFVIRSFVIRHFERLPFVVVKNTKKYFSNDIQKCFGLNNSGVETPSQIVFFTFLWFF